MRSDRKEVIRKLFFEYGTITMGMIAGKYPNYACDAKKVISQIQRELPPGFSIEAHIKGDWMNHSYTIKHPIWNQGAFSFLREAE